MICWIDLVVKYGNLTEEAGLILDKCQPIRKLSEEDEKKVCVSSCRMKKPDKGCSFKDKCPEKAKSWSKRNCCEPEEVCCGSAKFFIFNCDKCKHEFAIGIDKVLRKQWCPYCSHKKLCKCKNCYHCFLKSFLSYEKADYWNYKRNDKTPREVFKNSHEKYWFTCFDCKHDFDNSLDSIADKESWCSYCSHRKLCNDEYCDMCMENSFSSHEKADYWNYEKNDKTPREVFKKSGEKYWFTCSDCKHEFAIGIDKVLRGQWCPYCSHHKLCKDDKCKICFENSFASNKKADYWNYEKNDKIPREVFKHDNDKYWFTCSDCKHDFKSILSDISSNESWCPYCAHQKLCDDEDCKMCYENSFVSHEKADYWNYEKNVKTPREVFKRSSNEKYRFICLDCKHDFDSALNNISNGCWCPYCSSPPKRLCKDNNCKMCFENSFANHPKAKNWNYELNNEIPRNVFKHSNKKYWFTCFDCKHDFETSLSIISDGSWCPYCSNPPKKLCDDDECKMCFENSFASHPNAKYWSDENKLTPRDIFRCTANKYWFYCNKCRRKFYTSPHIISRGSWCPHCHHKKTENKMYDFFLTIYKDIEREKRYDWCRGESKNHFPFDFYILCANAVAECDGLYHFKQSDYYTMPIEIRQARDRYKEKCALEHGISVIRIFQEDVWSDKTDWKKDLVEAIEKCKTLKEPQVITIGKIYETIQVAKLSQV
jgi:DNA-directed RNA polymerase subunit RPC12/RpoP